jgi:hypothetical protein
MGCTLCENRTVKLADLVLIRENDGGVNLSKIPCKHRCK